jgi:hypothetical protein
MLRLSKLLFFMALAAELATATYYITRAFHP